ncbi:MAG: hypothetical protein IPH11_12815 [Ignavibacteriales bacterium]|nr:hypothetical protein [Ignavibacteriales bacterium]
MPDKKINISFTVTGEEAAKKLKDYAKSLEDIGDKSKRTTPSIKENNFALMNTSRIVQDLPFGFMGIGNNITFMAEQMSRAKAEGISYTAQLKGMASSLMGTGGLMFAISAVTSLLTYFSLQSRGASKELDNFTLASVTATESTKAWSDSIKKITSELSAMTAGEILNSIALMEKNLSDLDLTAGKLLGKMTFVESKYGILGELFFGSDLDDTVKKIIEAQASLNVATSLGESRGRIPELRGKIKTLEDLRDKIPEGVNDSVFQSYAAGIKKYQEELDGLLGKEVR